MKKNLIKISSLALALITMIQPISAHAFEYELDGNNNSIEFVEYQSSDSDDFTNETNVYAMIASEYQVTIPKTIVLSGDNKSANYNVTVSGDIAGYESILVEPDESVTLKAINKTPVQANISQNKTSWKYSEFDTIGQGFIDASNITAGAWSGNFNFNIKLNNESVKTIQLENGYVELTKIEEESLIDELIVMGEISSVLQVDEFYEAKAVGDVEFPVTLTMEVDANDGDKIAVYHHNGTNWEYITLATVQDGKINATFNSFSPIMIVNQTKHGLYQEPGLYNEEDVLVRTWSELEELGLNVETDHTDPGYRTDTDSAYYTFSKNNLSGKLILPNTITKIGANTFHGCPGLKEIVIPNSVKSIGDWAFAGVWDLTYINIPESVTEIGESAFFYCKYLKKANLPSGLTKISPSIFAWCYALEEITIPSGVTRIGYSAFSLCENLTTVNNLSESLKIIDSSAFQGTNFETIYLPNGLEKIEENTFRDCKSLKEIAIPNTVTYIGQNAFNNTSIKELHIPDSVTAIGSNAFKYIKHIYYYGTAPYGNDNWGALKRN